MTTKHEESLSSLERSLIADHGNHSEPVSKCLSCYEDGVRAQAASIFVCGICGKSQPGTKFQSEVELYRHTRYGVLVKHIGKRCVECKGKRAKVDAGRV